MDDRMGTLLHGSFDCSDEMCGCHGCNYEHVQAAIDGDETALRRLTDEQLQDAADALESCRAHSCDNHASDRSARRLLDALINAREAELEERGGCERCANGCGACLGTSPEVG